MKTCLFFGCKYVKDGSRTPITSKTEFFQTSVKLKGVNLFHKQLHLRCFGGPRCASIMYYLFTFTYLLIHLHIYIHHHCLKQKILAVITNLLLIKLSDN